MKVRTLVVAVVLCVIAVVTPVHAMTVDDARLVQSAIDPGTGLEMRVLLGGASDVSIEFGDRTVRIEKQLIGRTAFTRLVTPTEQLTIAVNMQRITVDGTLGHAEATPDRRGASVVRSLLARSEAVRLAVALLGRIDPSTKSPASHTLFSTRVMLLSELGDPRGQEDLARWIRTARQTMSVAPVAYRGGPGECWTEYEKEALAAWDEYTDCLKGVAWYDVAGDFVCGTLYDVRAIGAMSWYMHCVALR